MTLLPRGVKVHLALDLIDMRKGLDGLTMLVQGVLRHDPFSGHLFVFRGRRANLIKIVYWDGTGLCLFTKRLEQGVFQWPRSAEPSGTMMLTSAQLSMLIDGLDWRAPERQWHGSILTSRGCSAASSAGRPSGLMTTSCGLASRISTPILQKPKPSFR
jgi:transposase